MQELVAWLLEMEEKARDLYLAGSKLFSEDPVFSKFLDGLAKDEADHARYMETALRHLRKHPPAEPAAVSLDAETRGRLSRPVREALFAMHAGRMLKGELLETVAVSELSEWNDLFLYVVNTLSREEKDLELGASRMPAHIRKIQEFASGPSGNAELASRFATLPPVWKRKILVVDASPTVRDLLAALFKGEAGVTGVGNGKEALTRVRAEHFDVVLTEFELPGLSGIDLFKKATVEDPAQGRRFLFFSGFITREHKAFLAMHNLSHIQKPGGIQTIKDAVKKVADMASDA